MDCQTKREGERLNQTEVEARYDPKIICNNCKEEFEPYPHSFAPTIDEVICKKCGTKRILYYGEDTSAVKMILGTYGVNKELFERLDKIEVHVASLTGMIKTSLDDARNVMTKALIGALKEQLNQHENEWHGYGEKSGKQQS